MGYTVSDLQAVSVGFLLFSLFAFAPGYTFGWASNAFEFRRRRLAARLAAAVPLSIGLAPITAYFLWRWWLPLVWIIFGACGVACAILLVRDVRASRLQLSRAGWLVVAVSMGWLVAGALSLLDLQIGNRLYFPVSSYDRATRVAFTAALSRGGIPPHNPFFFAGLPAPLRYHYFWLIPCSLVDQLGGSLVSARVSLIAGVLWCGLGLLALIALYLRFFQGKGGEQIERRTLIAVALLGVTGLDILPVLIMNATAHVIVPTIEWWNLQVSAWITTMLWVPHDLAALIAGLTGFLVVWDAARPGQRRQTILGFVAGGLCFASAVGASVYVGITVAAGCALWLVIALLKRWRRHALVLASAGILAAALLLPFLVQVTRGPAGAGASLHSAPVVFTVRSFTFADMIVQPASPSKLLALNATLLPLNYFLEFGFFFVVACLGVRRLWRRGFRDQAEWGAAALGAASLLICTFMRSSVIINNDLGVRSSLVVQFILLLWAAEMWDEGTLGFGPSRVGPRTAHPRAAPSLVAVTVVLGVLGSCYELCLQRTFPILSDFLAVQKCSWLSPDHQLGRRTFELRRAYEELNRMLPASATVQADPEDGIGNVPAGLYSDRQMVAGGGSCNTVFGGSEKFCEQVILPRLKPLFDDRQPVTAAEVTDTCREFSITALLFEDTDPVWKDQSSWIWKTHPLLSNDFVRVIKCGAGAGAQMHGGTH
ncbi:MAG TPA: hypothetical protein VMW54_10010 [Terriglobia bacterium]|nr:hypothetical protein [Terriglobia bacterium]